MTAGLKEQAAQIQKVSDHVELSKTASQLVVFHTVSPENSPHAQASLKKNLNSDDHFDRSFSFIAMESKL
jgi:hypothetical protein